VRADLIQLPLKPGHARSLRDVLEPLVRLSKQTVTQLALQCYPWAGITRRLSGGGSRRVKPTREAG
jgi:hypothetical protein